MKKQIMSVIVLIASMTGCAATADATDGEAMNEPASESVSASSKPKPSSDAGTVTAKDTGASTDTGSAPADSGSASADSGSADSGSAAVEDTGSTAPDLCPSTQPKAGAACTDSGSGFCGYAGPCGIAFASCVGGVWELSGSSSC